MLSRSELLNKEDFLRGERDRLAVRPGPEIARVISVSSRTALAVAS